jgi:hypothetical protein
MINIVYDSTFNVLNYGYALLEAECLRAINKVGLDAHVEHSHLILVLTLTFTLLGSYFLNIKAK